MSAIERYARAAISSDLRHHEHACDTDRLAAAAMCDEEFGGMLFRLKYSLDSSVYGRVKAKFAAVVARHVVRKAWSLRPLPLAQEALDYWLADMCPACQGKGYLPILGTPHLSDDPCPACAGSRKRAIDSASPRQVLELVDMLEDRMRLAAGRMMAKLSSDMAL